MPGRVLIIAGSDSGGGAGIQADLKTVTCLGAFAATAVTALTVQNTQGVFGVHAVPNDFIARQIEAVVTDIGADVIKTGMLATSDVIGTVADTLDRIAPHVPRVVDPVMRAKGGHPLLASDAAQTLIARMVKGATIVTPNLPEAEVLTGRQIRTVADMEAAIPACRALGAGAILLKGGHVEGDTVVDILITAATARQFVSPRIQSTSTHGTGCTLASGIAAGLAGGLTLEAAVVRARDYVRRAIETAPGLGKGHGPLNHGHTVSIA
ncbi:MAG: bifunctional hydroxymethylpyrimidine kinase/phosphomethylpyrimidine kinase [Alphaproteobacteria bacterium]|nr:bifunctional hydroxymethylpyrimidine kinase/phosphomethylpyrimidine kinase [Alphaproteobacteria bacterium]